MDGMKRRTLYPHLLKVGTWNVQCQRCGFDFKNTDIVKEWTGLHVCLSCFETRHPQELLKGRPDDPSIPWSSPDSDGGTTYVDVNGDTQPNESIGCGPSSVPNQAVPNCAVPNNDEGYVNPL